ncbi:MAG TPA: hypothetical protein VFF73_12010 [Planctomycetota bacterium]|nr:hypothetical protein [Planctomycetota bacterium]
MTDLVVTSPPPELAPSFTARQVRRALDLATAIVGFATLIALLAVVAAIPVLQLVSLGYLLEAEGRVARSGKFLGALPGLRPLARVGSAVIGTFFTFLPWLVARDVLHDAWLIDPASRATRNAGIISLALGLAGLAHASLAILRGGRLRFFFRPIANVRWALARERSGEGLGLDRIGPAIRSLALPHYFTLGLKGFLAALLWIAIPTALLAVGPKAPPIALLGGVLLSIFVIPLPLLQANLAATGRFTAGLDVKEAWCRCRRAPLAALIALVAALALAIPLYLLKIELIPRDARSFLAAIFLLTILPTKLLAGKAWARGGREGKAFLPLRAFAALVALAPAGFYVLIVFLTRFIEWRGALGLFEQHAFLVPVAFY